MDSRGLQPNAESQRASDDSRTSVRPVPVDSPGRPISREGSSQNSPRHREAAGVALPEERTVISKRPPIAEALPLRPALNPFELGRTLEGQRLGHFQLEKFVGGGGMGAVFRATDTMLGRTVAVKVMSREQTDDDTLRRFQNEAQSAARLDHPNIARVYYVGEDSGLNYIVFEFIEGVNIRELVDEHGPLPLDEAIGYTLQVAEALQHASQRDVVHRDIKPSNVLVMPDGHAKLVDMGLARLHQVEATAGDLTASGVTLGTFDYISPEQARDPRSADVRSDLYSLGCTFYFMLTGRPPFPDGTVLQKLLSHSGDPPPDVRTFRPELSDEVSAILNKLLAKQPAQRYQDPSELIGALLLLADRLGLEKVIQGGKVWIATRDSAYRSFERQMVWLAPVLVLLLIALALHMISQQAESMVGELPRPSFAEMPAPVAPAKASEASTTDSQFADAEQETSPRSPAAGSSQRTDTPRDDAKHPAGVEPAKSNTGSSNNRAKSKAPPREPSAGNPLADAAESTESRPETGRDGLAVASDISERLAVVDGEFMELRASEADAAERAATALPRVQRLVVGSRDQSLPQDAHGVASLAEALRIAADAPEIQSVELRFSGEQLEPPIDIPARPLRIFAADGCKPILKFRPAPADAQFRRQMIHVPEAELEWTNVHFLFELPREVHEDWSLFQLDRTVSLKFQACSLTIRNVDQDGALLQDRVAFIEFLVPTAAEPNVGNELPTMMVRRRTRIELQGCLARGQATFVRSPVGVPFRLSWDQGLFVSTERLIECGGAPQPPTLGKAVEVDLRHVTLFVRKGLYSTQLDAAGVFPLEFVSECNNSIVLTDMTSPLIEQHGTTAQPFHKRPIVRGAKNFYPNTSVILLSDPTGNASDLEQFTFNQRDHLSDERKWYEERPEPGMVMWKTTPQVNRSVDRHSKDDYLLENEPSNGMRRDVGFDPAQLPELPAALTTPPVTSPPPSTED